MSRRHEDRRAERQHLRRDLPLTAAEIVRLNAQRTLPPDHPSAQKHYFKSPPQDLVWHAIDVVEASGVLPYLQRRLRCHPGRTSALPLQALLVALVAAAFEVPSYRRADVCAVLHGIEAEPAHQLGLCSRVARTLFPYNVIDKQLLRLERALTAGWVDPDGTRCGQDWFAHSMLKANIAPDLAEKITAVALDSTFLLAWAVPYGYPEGEQPPGGRRSADPDARFGHRSATAKRKAGKRLGFDLHVVCGVRGSKKWSGNPKNPSLKEDTVSLVPLHMKLVPANPDVAPIAIECIEWAKQIAPDIEEVIADPMYTMKYARLNRRLHAEALRVVMKLDKTELTKVRELMLGDHDHRLIEHCGTFFPWWLPEELRTPPDGLKGKKRRRWFDRRARYRYSIDQILSDGSVRMMCPQCAGRIRSNLKTRNPRARPNREAPYITRTDGAEYCCPGRVTVPVEHLDRYQAIPYGTTAHKKSCGRRNQIENLNGILRNKGGLEDRWCHALGSGARFVGSVMMGVAYLLGETKQAWQDRNNGNADHHPEDPDAGNDDPAGGDAGDEPAPESDGHNSTDRSRDGPD